MEVEEALNAKKALAELADEQAVAVEVAAQ